MQADSFIRRTVSALRRDASSPARGQCGVGGFAGDVILALRRTTETLESETGRRNSEEEPAVPTPLSGSGKVDLSRTIAEDERAGSRDSAERLHVQLVTSRAVGVRVAASTEDSKHRSATEQPGGVVHLLHAGTPLPARATQQFATATPNQGEINIEVWEQVSAIESPILDANRMIGSGRMSVPPLPQGSPVDVTIQADADGVIVAQAVDLITGQILVIELQIANESMHEAGLNQAGEEAPTDRSG